MIEKNAKKNELLKFVFDMISIIQLSFALDLLEKTRKRHVFDSVLKRFKETLGHVCERE